MSSRIARDAFRVFFEDTQLGTSGLAWGSCKRMWALHKEDEDRFSFAARRWRAKKKKKKKKEKSRRWGME